VYYYAKEDRERVAMIDLGANESARRAVLGTLAELRPLSEKVQDWMRVMGYPRKDIFSVKLALEEAAVNAFRHGNQGDPAKVVRVNFLVTLAETFVEVEDEGPGFDPGQVHNPLAGETAGRITCRGLFLMRVYLSGVSFNPRGNRVTLWRRRSEI
jgi:serine/threonine-protein kinase RsbW